MQNFKSIKKNNYNFQSLNLLICVGIRNIKKFPITMSQAVEIQKYFDKYCRYLQMENPVDPIPNIKVFGRIFHYVNAEQVFFHFNITKILSLTVIFVEICNFFYRRFIGSADVILVAGLSLKYLCLIFQRCITNLLKTIDFFLWCKEY